MHAHAAVQAYHLFILEVVEDLSDELDVLFLRCLVVVDLREFRATAPYIGYNREVAGLGHHAALLQGPLPQLQVAGVVNDLAGVEFHAVDLKRIFHTNCLLFSRPLYT